MARIVSIFFKKEIPPQYLTSFSFGYTQECMMPMSSCAIKKQGGHEFHDRLVPSAYD
jgi:hypothetical protein